MANVANVTIDATKVSADLTDYVVYIDLSELPSSFWNTVANGGGDIRVYKSDGTTELAREVVSCVTASDTGELHVKYSGTLSSSVDTVIQIHADGTSSDYAVTATYGRNNVWSDYAAVYHLQTSSNDSTGTYNGTDNSITYQADVIGQGALFNATSDYINLGSNTSFQYGETDAFTIQTWFTANSRAGNDFLFGRQDHGGQFIGYSLYMKDTSGGLRWDMYANLSGNNNTRDWTAVIAANSTPYLIHLVSSGSGGAAGTNVYRNGSLQTGSTLSDGLTSTPTITTNFNIGNRDQSTLAPDGSMDEFRIRDAALTADWNLTEYNNQNSPSTFYSASAVGGGGGTTYNALAFCSF